ncbi:MAG: hypothetical protein E7544_04120 [Ruminococcaceae bacterium]|nr:hypothetical protein [Oscillospiraceae bacterium]
MLRNKFKEWFSVQLVKKPGGVVLVAILLFNIIFFLASAITISALSLEGTEKMGFIEAAFCTITMILDAGCIQFVVEDIGQSGVLITLVCLFIIFVGMISFTGAVIGYITNYISGFIDNANLGKRKLHLSEHFVILNWNSRASEIVNDMLYCDKKQNVVVLVPARKAEIEREIEERINDTLRKENKAIERRYKDAPWLKRKLATVRYKFRRNVVVLVREGDIFSAKQLEDISLDKARSVIILGSDINNSVCRFGQKEKTEELSRGNSQTIKTLMQVADITSAEGSYDNQRIIVEITDEWTGEVVNKIIEAKQVDAKCNIIPVRVNEVLGQILSQFCLMPELNHVYSELFSNKGAEFYTEECEDGDEMKFLTEYLADHNHALPVTIMKNKGKFHRYYVAENDEDVDKRTVMTLSDYEVSLNNNYKMETKNVIILGHNSKCKNIMAGFNAFRNEWKTADGEPVRIVVVDDKKSLEKMNYYREYPFVIKTVEAEIYDKDLICETIEEFVSSNKEDTSVLILSDDSALTENIDAGALANLVYVREIINRKLKENPDFDEESVDIIVEIINPKHHDIVSSYSVNNVVISNRYISKMVTQISEVEALFEFYNDILSYDDEVSNGYSSKEVYIKKIADYFEEIPEETTADKLVRAVFNASVNTEKKEDINPTIALGYVKPGGRVKIFGGDLSEINVKLELRDKMILFSAH